jgi:hypothetical protein
VALRASVGVAAADAAASGICVGALSASAEDARLDAAPRANTVGARNARLVVAVAAEVSSETCVGAVTASDGAAEALQTPP